MRRLFFWHATYIAYSLVIVRMLPVHALQWGLVFFACMQHIFQVAAATQEHMLAAPWPCTQRLRPLCLAQGLLSVRSQLVGPVKKGRGGSWVYGCCHAQRHC